MVSNRAYLNEKDMLLKTKEFSLLIFFIKNEGHNMDADYIYKTVWELPANNFNLTLKKHISELRKKPENRKIGYTIISVYGKGYCFIRE